jgi:hypothetical protein
MAGPFDDVTLWFTWRYMPKTGKWGRMTVTEGGSDYATGPGLACFCWQPMYGLMFTHLDLTGVPTGSLDDGGGQYVLARAVRESRYNHWTRILPNGMQMWRAMERAIHAYMGRMHADKEEKAGTRMKSAASH